MACDESWIKSHAKWLTERQYVFKILVARAIQFPVKNDCKKNRNLDSGSHLRKKQKQVKEKLICLDLLFLKFSILPVFC